ncbi:hypothetical protein [Paenibacillus koleovorans]|uniref:hypothetical protein n=1 Tax=Paenibacillus koleovorans TaxID=121608 RepID=UPI001580580F|nr:hypothetical protein [Paenibacillus koleovorans]
MTKKTAAPALASVLLVSGVLTACGDNGKSTTNGTGDEVKSDVKPFTVSLRHTQVRDDAKPRLKLLEDVATCLAGLTRRSLPKRIVCPI